MKKAVKTFFALAAISLALCSCSDSGSSGSDGDSGTENRVLDLRIQNGGVPAGLKRKYLELTRQKQTLLK